MGSPSPRGADGGSGYWRAQLGLHGAVALFGVAGLFGKWVTAHPIAIVFGRVLVASAAFALLLPLLPAGGARPGPRDRLLLGACGAILAFHWFAFFHSIQLSTVAVGLLSYSTAPVFVALLEPAWLGERFSRRALICAGICVAGVALIVPRWDAGDVLLRGVGWGVLAGFSFAVLSLLNRQLVRRHSSFRVAFYQDAVATVMLAPLLPFVWQPLPLRQWVLLGALGVFCTALAHSLFIQAMKTVQARLAAIVSALEPVYGIVLAFLLLAEVPPPRTLLGGALILAAVLWDTLGAHRERGAGPLS